MKTRLSIILLLTLITLPAASCVALRADATAAAQTTVKVNPTEAVWAAKADYSTVTSFTLEVYRQSDMALVRSTNVGKPTPNGANELIVPLARTGLQNNVVHVFKIVTINPIGSQGSATTSNPFVMGDLPVAADGLIAR